MSGPEAQASVQLLRRQYLQLLEPQKLAIPKAELIRLPFVQHEIYDELFAEKSVSFLAPRRYQYRVLKILVDAMEKAIVDPEEDVCDIIDLDFSILF